jgi:hypothetical protein
MRFGVWLTFTGAQRLKQVGPDQFAVVTKRVYLAVDNEGLKVLGHPNKARPPLRSVTSAPP